MDIEAINFFRDAAVQADPYPYFDALREKSPVFQEPNFGVYMVTGFEEALAVYNDSVNFSSCNVVSGPFQKFPVPLEGDDVSDIIEEHRDGLSFSDQLPSFDPPKHTEHRALMMRLLTPNRLRANEEFMWRYADTLLDPILAKGGAEFITEFAAPFTLVVVAELEGVPESDFGLFTTKLTKAHEDMQHKPLEFLYEAFSGYIEERRREPRGDIMTAMAQATFPDGTTPTVQDVALLAANLFSGGQETTVRLLSFALRMLAERQDVQAELRANRDKIPNFVEEILRYESPLRVQFRMARRAVTVGGVNLPPGATMMLLPGAGNRDPRQFADAGTFDVDRENAKLHLAFGHGIHHCAGSHLARAEGRVTLNRLFDRTESITVDEDAHGMADARRYDYLPTYFLRGLARLNLRFA